MSGEDQGRNGLGAGPILVMLILGVALVLMLFA